MPDLKALFHHYLQQLDVMLQQVPDDLFNRSLAPDMLNLAEQARTAIQFSLRIYCPLVHVELPDLEAKVLTRAALQQQLHQTQRYMNQLPVWPANDDQRRIYERAGFAELQLSETDFVYLYGLPNFYFHISMVYAIARAQGVDLSKGDFDGFHQYPPGFSFVTGQ